MLVPMVDVIFADVAQPDQARIVGLNAQVRVTLLMRSTPTSGAYQPT
jgi:fibrillarin-like rRNA methylase